MAITYTWEVTGIKKDENGTVVQTYWKKTGEDEHGHTGTFAGATPVSGSPLDENYIQFDQLTEADVLGWIQDVVVGSYEEHVNGKIQEQIDAQHIVDADMPWAPAPAEEPAP